MIPLGSVTSNRPSGRGVIRVSIESAAHPNKTDTKTASEPRHETRMSDGPPERVRREGTSFPSVAKGGPACRAVAEKRLENSEDTSRDEKAAGRLPRSPRRRNPSQANDETKWPAKDALSPKHQALVSPSRVSYQDTISLVKFVLRVPRNPGQTEGLSSMTRRQARDLDQAWKIWTVSRSLLLEEKGIVADPTSAVSFVAAPRKPTPEARRILNTAPQGCLGLDDQGKATPRNKQGLLWLLGMIFNEGFWTAIARSVWSELEETITAEHPRFRRVMYDLEKAVWDDDRDALTTSIDPEIVKVIRKFQTRTKPGFPGTTDDMELFGEAISRTLARNLDSLLLPNNKASIAILQSAWRTVEKGCSTLLVPCIRGYVGTAFGLYIQKRLPILIVRACRHGFHHRKRRHSTRILQDDKPSDFFLKLCRKIVRLCGKACQCPASVAQTLTTELIGEGVVQ